jgi:hypothetical protein
VGRVDSHGVVTFNMDAFKKSDSIRTDLTIPFLQKYPLTSLPTPIGQGVPILSRRQSNLRKGKSLRLQLYEAWAIVVIFETGSDITQKWRDIQTKYGYESFSRNAT